MSTNRDGRDILMKVFLFVSHAIQENIHSLNLMRSINEKNLEIFHIFHPNGYYVGTTQANDHQKIITIRTNFVVRIRLCFLFLILLCSWYVWYS